MTKRELAVSLPMARLHTEVSLHGLAYVPTLGSSSKTHDEAVYSIHTLVRLGGGCN